MSKQKAAGTREETAAVEQAKAEGLDAGRHPEGGIYDRGDIYITDGYNDWDGEVKATQTLSVHTVLAKQAAKASATARPFLLWNRRLLASPDHKRRTSLGKIVVLRWTDFLWCLSHIRQLELQVMDLLDQINDEDDR